MDFTRPRAAASPVESRTCFGIRVRNKFRHRRNAVFFDRPGPRPASLDQHPMTSTTRRRNWAALGLAVAMAAPLGVSQFSRLYAQEAVPTGDRAADAARDLELVKLGRQQFEKH